MSVRLSITKAPKSTKNQLFNLITTIHTSITTIFKISIFWFFLSFYFSMFVQNKIISRDSIERGKETRVKCSVKFENYPPLGV